MAEKVKAARIGKLGSGLAALVALVALAVLAPVAQANYDPLASGTTKLSLDKSFLALLKENGVKLSAVAPAKLKGTAVSFPISGGKFDPTNSKGTVEHEGALLFKAGARSIPLKSLQLKTTQKHSPLSVKAGGGQLKLAQAKSMVVSREGFGDKVKVSSLSLSGKVATRLGRKLHLKGVFKEGQPLGQTLTKASPETITVLGQGKVELNLDPGIVVKLKSLFVAVNPIFPAEHPGAFTLPIFGGTIAPTGSAGTLETEGSLELLQLGGGQVFFREPWLDLATKALSAELDSEPAPPYPGKVGRVAIAGLTLTSPAVANAKARTVAIASASLALPPQIAASFNEVFAKPQGKDNVFVAGEALGTMSFVAQGQ
jgi:hypothetical protein